MIRILLTLLVAMSIQFIPISASYRIFVPDFVALTLIFWLIYAPHVLSAYAIFILGIACDVAFGSVLGEHCLSLVLTSYLVYRLLRPLRVWPMWQQYLLIFVILFANRFTLVIVKLSQGFELGHFHFFWLSPFVGLVCWPLLRNIMFNFSSNIAR